jgi:hypothetical protein
MYITTIRIVLNIECISNQKGHLWLGIINDFKFCDILAWNKI